jgi:cell division protein FtsZ
MENRIGNKVKKPVIKIVGIGGGGCNFQEHMVNVLGDILPQESFIAVNTDAQSLEESKAFVKIQIGPDGLGAGANPIVGRDYAEFSSEEISKYLVDCDLVLIFSGLGGGTGSGATPVAARIAKEMGALVFSIVTKPFLFEGHVRAQVAKNAIEEVKKNSDVTVVVSNQLLFKITDQTTSFQDAFKIIDGMCASFVAGIITILQANGLINLDFADLDSTIKQKGDGIIGVGYSEGDDAAIEATSKALANPLLENVSMKNASNALVHISGNYISLIEVEAIMKKIYGELGDNVHIIHGMSICEKSSYLSPVTKSASANMNDSYSNNDFKTSSNYTDYYTSLCEGKNSIPTKWVKVMIIVTGLNNMELNSMEFTEYKTPIENIREEQPIAVSSNNERTTTKNLTDILGGLRMNFTQKKF